MDLKGIAWAGNIYQKFEAMCLEIEEVMYQDTVKYLENQVGTVGSSVKKFYSEVMQDIISSAYVDPVKVAAADLPLNPYSHAEVIMKPKQPMKQNPAKPNTKKTEDCEAPCDSNSEHKEAFGELDSAIHHAHGDIGIRVCSDSYSVDRKVSGLYRRPSVSGKENCKNDALVKLSRSTDPVLGDSSKTSSFCHIREKDDVPSATVEAYDAREADNISCSRLADTNFCTSSAQSDPIASGSSLSGAAEVLSIVDLSRSSDIEANCTMSYPIASNIKTVCASTPEEVIMSLEGRSDNFTIDAVSNRIELEIIERLDESKFEDTCVLVEGDELQVSPEKKGKPKSYKKKFQEAFPVKMKSTRKQEYEKLAKQYSAQASKLEEMDQLMPAGCAEDKSKSIEAQDMPESEWELL